MLKPILFSLLFLAQPFWATSQDAPAHQRLALVVSPNIGYIAAKQSIGEQLPRLGFHARIDGEQRLAERLWLRVGAGWSLLRYKTDVGKNLQWPNQNNGNGGFNPTQPGESASVYLLREDKMLSFPVALRYFLDKKQHFYADLETGGSLIFVQNGDDVLRPNFGLAVGWQTTLGQRTWLFVQPAFRFIVNPSLPQPLQSYNQHPYSIGLDMGLRHGLR